MKTSKILLLTAIVASVASVFISGCKYKVTAPMWDQSYTEPPSPTITSIDPPSEAVAGVNTITIHGHNLVVASSDSLVPDTTLVTFDNVAATLASADSTTIVVYRPKVVGQDTIKVIPHNAISEALYGPYRIDSVIKNYGGFLQNLSLGAIAIGSSDTPYVFETATKILHKATSPTDNVVVGTLPSGSSTPAGAVVGSDGNLYVMENIRPIGKVNLATGTFTERWVTLPAGEAPACGDCGPGGYLFVGGDNTDLIVFSLSNSGVLTSSDMAIGGGYASEQILAIKVYNGYVYVASRTSSKSPAVIWKNQIIGDSSVGPRQEVLDLGTTPFAGDLITGIAFSSTGKMFLSTASDAPILVFDKGTGKLESFYKGIVPPVCLGMAYSRKSDYMYVITGDGSSTNAFSMYRIDMGETGGANF